MPLHHDCLSRRRFFRGAIILTASASSYPLRAANSSETWALLSDTHIAADPAAESRGVNMTAHLEKVIAEILAERDQLSGVIIDGDVALDDGQPGDYTQLKKLLEPLVGAGLPIHCTLGNHDDRAHFLDAYPEFSGASSVENKHCSVIETGPANLVLIDTLRFVDQVEGEIGATQQKWIAEYLEANPDKPAIVIGHHYPQVFRTDVIPGDKEIKISGLIDSESFLEVLHSHPAAKAYLFGHSHRWGVQMEENELTQVNLPPTAYVFDGTRPSGWVRAAISAEGMKLELRSLDPSHPQHGETHDLAWS